MVARRQCMDRGGTPLKARGRGGAWPALLLVPGLFGCVPSHAKEVLPAPTYENTFYLFMNDGYRGSPEGDTPYDDGWPNGPLTYELQLAKLRDMISRIGPDGPYLRLGVADCVWPTDTVDPYNDWNYQGLIGLGETGGMPADDVEIPKGPDPYLNQVIIRSWAELGMPGFVFFNSGNLTRQTWFSYDDTLALPSNLTAFLEQFPEAVQRYDDNRISIADDLDGIHEPRDYVEDEFWNGNRPRGTMLGYSRLLPDSIRGYWDRNMKAAMEHVLQMNQRYPGLVVAISIEPENDMNFVRCQQGQCGFYADFSPLAMEEWRQWLSHSGIYGPDGDYDGQGADPWYSSVSSFNAATGSSFSSWDEVDPRSPNAGPGVWDMYLDGGDQDGQWSSDAPPGSGSVQGWCETMVEHRCEDSVDLLWGVAQTAAWSTDRIFTHQVPGGFVDEALNPADVPKWGYGHRMCTLRSCAVDNGRPGITGFRESTVNIRLFDSLREELSPDGAWANLEFNPLMHRYCDGYTTDYDLWSDAYRLNWERGAHILCGFRWWVPPEATTWWANIRPDFHRPPEPDGDPTIEWESRLQATHDFVSSDAVRFRPWSPEGVSLGDVADYLPPSPRLGDLRYDAESEVISFVIDPELYEGCKRLLWYDERDHPEWPGQNNVFGWPEFSNGMFHVYRDTLPSFTPGPQNLLALLSVHTLAVVDSSPPTSSAVFYAVTAVDNGGDRSDPARIWVAPQVLVGCDSVAVTLFPDETIDTTVVIGNIGLKPLVIDSVVASAPWLSVGRYPSVIDPDSAGDLRVSVSTAGLGAGAYYGAITIYSNDPFLPEATVTVELAVQALHAPDRPPGPGQFVITPQPAADIVTLTWALGRADSRVEVELLDLAGRVTRTLSGASDATGVYTVHLALGPDLPNGVYVARLTSGAVAVQRRLVLLR